MYFNLHLFTSFPVKAASIKLSQQLYSESRISEPSIRQPAEGESLCVEPAAFEWKPHLRAKHMSCQPAKSLCWASSFRVKAASQSQAYVMSTGKIIVLSQQLSSESRISEPSICQPAKSLCWASSFGVKAASQSLPTNHWTMPNPKSTETPKLEENFFYIIIITTHNNNYIYIYFIYTYFIWCKEYYIYKFI